MDIRDASDQTLVAELERRGFFSRMAALLEAKTFEVPLVSPQVDPFDARPPKPPLGRFIPGTDRELPKGAQSVIEIPDRSNKDGSQLRLITVGGPGATEDPKPKFILKGSAREDAANAFITQWKEEIKALENELATEVLPQERIDAIWSEIRRLEGQINLRAASAFTGLGIEEVRARNAAQSEGVLDAPAEAGVAGRGVVIEAETGLPVFDTPQFFPVYLPHLETYKPLLATLDWDPFVLHLPKPFTREVDGHLEVLESPLVVWRLLVLLEALVKRGRGEIHKDIAVVTLATAWNNHLLDRPGYPLINTEAQPSPAMSFQSGWTSLLLGLLRTVQTEKFVQGLKRTIRIFNVDFQEQEAPDFMFEEGTDGANPLGRQQRPHVNARDAWKEVQEGPGVFRMSRQPKGGLEDDPDHDIE